MKDIQRSVFAFLTFAGLLLAATIVSGTQSAPVLDQAYAGAVTVTGKVTPGNGSISIFDISNTPRTELGVSQSVDKDGNFAANVNPALISGHRVVVVDAKGSTSEAMVVRARPDGPAGPR